MVQNHSDGFNPSDWVDRAKASAAAPRLKKSGLGLVLQRENDQTGKAMSVEAEEVWSEVEGDEGRQSSVIAELLSRGTRPSAH